MKHRVTVRSPYGKLGFFVSGMGGLLIVVGFRITGDWALFIIVGLAVYGYLCGKYAPNHEIDAIKDINLEQSYNITREMKKQSRGGERCYLEHSTAKKAEGVTPLGSLLFGRKVEVRRYIEED